MEKNKKIGVGVFMCLCKNCGSEFEIYRMSDFIYGEKLILTEDGIDYAYLNCFDDEVFNEVFRIVKEYFKDKLLSDTYIECANKIFDLTCDTVNGKHIDSLRINYACPNCKSDNVKELNARPIKSTKVDFPAVSHSAWIAKNEVDKDKIIKDVLKHEECL